MRVLGIDPGTISMGYGLLEEGAQVRAVDWGALSMPRSLPMEHRLYQLYTHVENMVSMWHPDALAVEEPFMGRGESRFVGSAFAIGQAQAVALIAAAKAAVPVYRYSPAQVKRVVADHGAATKEQVQAMVKLQLGLEETPSPSDASDALAVALCHLRQQREAETMQREVQPRG